MTGNEMAEIVDAFLTMLNSGGRSSRTFPLTRGLKYIAEDFSCSTYWGCIKTNTTPSLHPGTV